MCWKRFTDDIVPIEKELETICTEGCEKITINREDALNCSYISNWFFERIEARDEKDGLFEELNNLDTENISLIEDIVIKYSKKEDLKKCIQDRIRFLILFLKYKKEAYYANLFYSIMLNQDEIAYFILYLIKKSIYEYILRLKARAGKKLKIAGDNSKAIVKKYLNYIENNWVDK